MKHIVSTRFWLVPALFLLLMAGCEKPIRAGATGEAADESPTAENPSEEAPTKPPASSGEGAEVTETKPPAPEPEPEPLPEEESVEPVLEVKKSKDKIMISGHLRSARQEEDMLRVLGFNFPDHEVVSELDVGRHIKAVGGWGNRINTFLVPLFQGTVDSARFHYEAGKITVEGTVPNAQQGNLIEGQAAYVFDDSTIGEFDIKLTPAQ